MYDLYKRGEWWAWCPVCGQKRLASTFKKRWDGQRVCEDDWEPRHPQELTRTPGDYTGVPYSRREIDSSVSVTYVDYDVGTSIPDGTFTYSDDYWASDYSSDGYVEP